MDSERPLVVPLTAAGQSEEAVVGAKAARLARLASAGAPVPSGFSVTTWAYDAFLRESGLDEVTRMELERKSPEDTRWEELWDSALRLRSHFRAAPLSDELRDAVSQALSSLPTGHSLAVRSSAVGEDAAGCSFAGLHESFVGVRGEDAVLDAIRLVWASLWSDAALLYRRELNLEPGTSRMAVVVQEFVEAIPSGVAFGSHPTRQDTTLAVIEAVPGPCQLLVDGLVEPDHWELERATGRVTTWRPGSRGETGNTPLLDTDDLNRLLRSLSSVETLLQWPPDIEWTGRREAFTLLQARPITSAVQPDDERQRYLSLRPGDARLRELRHRVAGELIPALEAEGDRMVADVLDGLSDEAIADAIDERLAALERWRKIYWDEFIPFAHGVRRLATYYNDAVAPEDPYEFVGLLYHQPLMALERNAAVDTLARELSRRTALREVLERALDADRGGRSWSSLREQAGQIAGGDDFVTQCEAAGEKYLDIAYNHVRVRDQPAMLLNTVLELSRRDRAASKTDGAGAQSTADALVSKLRAALGADRWTEAEEIIETARISWKLRDDDNILLARVESQLLRALTEGDERLRRAGRLSGRVASESDVGLVTNALRDPTTAPLVLQDPDQLSTLETVQHRDERPRQLMGQPASPGLATARARCVRGPADLGHFRLGEVLVCDAIQPTMTHLVPLASAIVERRGGMLIHGAIIARELAIPCVNGVRRAVDTLQTGDLVTVDGHLGIVTVGEPEFELEKLSTTT